MVASLKMCAIACLVIPKKGDAFQSTQKNAYFKIHKNTASLKNITPKQASALKLSPSDLPDWAMQAEILTPFLILTSCTAIFPFPPVMPNPENIPANLLISFYLVYLKATEGMFCSLPKKLQQELWLPHQIGVALASTFTTYELIRCVLHVVFVVVYQGHHSVLSVHTPNLFNP